MSVTAKVKVYKSAAYGDDVRLDFMGDYNDARNKAWASATPMINVTMIVKGDVAEKFEHAGAYTLTFEKETADA